LIALLFMLAPLISLFRDVRSDQGRQSRANVRAP
jgi:hypothetical protein